MSLRTSGTREMIHMLWYCLVPGWEGGCLAASAALPSSGVCLTLVDLIPSFVTHLDPPLILRCIESALARMLPPK